jgi:alpha-glucosidase
MATRAYLTAAFITVFLLPTIAFSENIIIKGEIIAEGIARFYPDGTNPDDFPISMAFVEEPRKAGDLPSNWEVFPTGLRYDDVLKYSFDVEDGTSLYGTGLIAGDLKRRDRTIFTWNVDAYIYTDKYMSLYQSHPWVLAVRSDGTAFGVLANTTYECRLDLFSNISLSSKENDFFCLVIEGGSPQEVMTRLASLIGTIPMPPVWMLGFHQSRWGYSPENQAKSVADKFRELNFPCDVIWIDINYMKYYQSFTFDDQRYPDPMGFTNYLRNRNFHSIWVFNPSIYVYSEYPPYKDGKSRDIWVLDSLGILPYEAKAWAGNSRFPDFTNPEARLWWGGFFDDFINDNGLDGLGLDMNEPSVFNGEKTVMHKNSIHQGGGLFKGGTHKQYHNIYGLLSAKAAYDGMLKATPSKRPVLFARSNFIGGQRYSYTWTGDNVSSWEHLRWASNMCINMGLSGSPIIGADIGGYSGHTSPEVYQRWMGIGAFYPFCRAHTSNQSPNEEPWVFDESTLNITRTAIQRRYRLIPYLYTLYYEAYTTGMPIMQPAFFADPTDPLLRDEEQVFLLGSDLMIVSDLYEFDKIEINEPLGIWNEFYLIDQELEDVKALPKMKIRGGAIIPAGRLVQSTMEPYLDTLTLYVCLDSKFRASGMLYEDEGEGWGFLEGDYLYTKYQANLDDFKVIVSINSESGDRLRPERHTIAYLITEDTVYIGEGNEQDSIFIEVPFTKVPILDDFGQDEPDVYYNKSLIRIDIKQTRNTRVSLYNLLGLLVFDKNFINDSETLSIPLDPYNLRSGFYLLKIVSNGKVWFKKVVL